MNKLFSIANVRRLFVAACLLFAGISHAASWRWIGPDQVLGLMREGSSAWLIDVRGPAAYESERIESAVNIPAGALAHKKFSPSKRLVLIDDSLGLRSAREAGEALAGSGMENVFILEGGVPEWSRRNYPMVVKTEAARGVTARDLAWAQEHQVPVTILDLRSSEERKAGMVERSEAIEGKDPAERVEGLKKFLERERSGGMAARLATGKTVVIVTSAADDATRIIQGIPRSLRGDLRYLVGGYEVLGAKRSTQTVGVCPTCPGAMQK